MYICLECFKVFEEPKKYYGEWLEHFGTPCREEHFASPCCEGDYEEAKMCDSCDEYIEGKYIVVEDNGTYCDNCYQTYEVGE